MNIEVNYLAVLFAGAASMAAGFLWYGPMFFGKLWMKEKGYTEQSMKKAKTEMGKVYGISFILSFVSAYVLTHVMVMSENFFHYPMASTGLISAFWMWLGFVMPTQVTATMFGNKNWKLLKIDAGYQLVSLLAMGFVIGMMA